MNGGVMLKKQSINSYALIVGLATFLALPITANADDGHPSQHPTNSPVAPAPGMSGAAITGSDSVVCGDFNNKVMAEINCLRRHLDTTAFRSNRRSSNDLGNYGCANRADRHQQVHCLRNILDGNGLAPGTQP